jgi:hypothetical protein
MSRLINFLQSDLKEIETSFESIKDVIDYKINYEENSILAKDLERIESFIIYWGHHAKDLKGGK